MTEQKDTKKDAFIELVKAVGAIAALPIAIYSVVNLIIENPGVTFIVAIILATLASIFMVKNQGAKPSNIIIAWLILIVLGLLLYIFWPRTMSVEGIVVDPSGNFLASENVSLVDVNNIRRETKTNAQGHYQFNNVPVGNYTIIVRQTQIDGILGGFIRSETVNFTIPVSTPTLTTSTLEPPETPDAPTLTTNTEAPNPTETDSPTPTIEPSATDSPTAHPSPTPTPTSVLGGNNCISTNIWNPYEGVIKPPNQSNCWKAEQYGFFTENGNITINLTNSLNKDKFYGLSTNIEDSVVIELILTINKLSVPNDLDGNIVFAIVNEELVSPRYGVALLFQVEVSNPIPPPLHIKTHERNQGEKYIDDLPLFEYGREYHIKIELTAGTVVFHLDNEKITDPITIPFSDRVFWLGYTIPPGGELIANISNITIHER
ncbi:MAG: hypothetical protein Fur0022_49000 [Anaerolineales bacterium]